MGFFKKKKASLEELEEERDRATIEEEVYSKKAEIAERKAVISELEKKYGKGWAGKLGISKLTDLTTLRSFLKNAKVGMEKESAKTGDSTLKSLVMPKVVRRA
jgi:hypothetical protein